MCAKFPVFIYSASQWKLFFYKQADTSVELERVTAKYAFLLVIFQTLHKIIIFLCNK